MVSEKIFASNPPFPNDIPIARISKISLAKLSAGNETEASLMFEACRTLGFFLLDLKGEAVGESFIRVISQMFGVTEEVFDLSYEDKMKYPMVVPNKMFGFKAMGIAKTETGRPDQCEWFTVGQDDLLGNEPARENPQVIHENRETMLSYLENADPIVQIILNILEVKLGLPKGKLSSLQRRNQPSGTNIRMIKCPPQAVNDMRTSMVQHTDFGTLTLLSNVIGGLQIPEKDSANEADNWRYVKPEPNCVIVNIGDALVEWTGGILRSNLHRVNFPPGDQASCTRYSIAYLIRPEKNASMKRLVSRYIPTAEEDGEKDIDLTALEWEIRKMVILRDGLDVLGSKGGKKLRTLKAEGQVVVA